MAEGVRFELTRPFGLPVFKTGAINRSATPPGEVVRAYFRISQAMGKVDRAVSLGGPRSGEGGLLDAKNTKTTRQLLTFS